MEQRFVASMVLAGVGDAMGYCNGLWEFCSKGEFIHNEVKKKGGIAALSLQNCIVSDDTVMHLATAETLVAAGLDPERLQINSLMQQMANAYIDCFNDMDGRAPGNTTGRSIWRLRASGRWDSISFDTAAGGCGGSMRAMSIGLRFFGESQRQMLVAIGIESGRLTHNHPTGFFGSLASAVFTALAIEGVPPKKWGRMLIEEFIPSAKRYCESVGRNWNDLQMAFAEAYFENHFKEFLRDRGIEDGESEPKYPEQFLENVSQRDAFYKKYSRHGVHGSSGDDSVIISYDAILACRGDWIKFAEVGILHGGDNDSTGCIGGAWFGALYGFASVPKINLEHLEYRDRLETLGKQLYLLTHPSPKN